MEGQPQRVLHIGGSGTDARKVREALSGSPAEPYRLEWVERLSDGLAYLTVHQTSAVLVDLGPPESAGIDGLTRLIRAAVPAVPVLVVGTNENEAIAQRAIAAGAHDYLVASRLDSYWLPRMLRHAIQRKLSEEALVADREEANVTLNSIGDALIGTDSAGRITYLNRVAETMTGWSRADAAGCPIKDVLQIVDAVTREPAELALQPSMTPSDAPRLVPSFVLLRRDGSESIIEHLATPTRDRLGLTVGTTTLIRDVSAAHALAVRLSHVAGHDALTDLPNRLLLGDRLARALALAHRHQRRLAVLFLDIDRFKHINDSLGHPIGDELLRCVGQAVSTCVRSSDTVSRQGGDEFIIVLSELEHVEEAAKGAQKIMASLAQPHRLLGHELRINVSIGISVYPDDGESAETLITRADMALYHAKNQGRNCYRFFEPDLNVRAVERQSIEVGLRRALDQQEFELFFQPKMNLVTGAIVGAEALIRWRHPGRGVIVPQQFMRIAEDCGLIKPIGLWVVREACQKARTWQTAGLPPIPVAVNISAVEFRSEGFVTQIADIVRETSLAPGFLEIELTESALMAHVDDTNSQLHALKAVGVRLAIDDFGTGWSSLSHLRHFPIDALKIDKSFVQRIGIGSDAAPVVRAAINVGKSLGYRVIAEGVETPQQLAFLRAEHCDEGQGYYLKRPMRAEEFGRLL